MPASIRPATQQDSDAVTRLATELGYPVKPEVMAKRVQATLASRTDLLLVAEEEGSIIGWAQAHAANIIESGFRVEIVGMIVSQAARRLGIGRMLVDEVERWARSLPAEMVVVRSNVNRTESHLFYSALGYKVNKTQTVYRKALG